MGIYSVVDRGGDGWMTSRICQAQQWQNVQELPETDVSRDR